MVADVLQELLPRLEITSTTCIDCEGVTDAHAFADRSQLRQVLTNLLSNAIDASPSDSVITVDATQEELHLRITVTDSGPGIKDNIAAQIFDPLFTTRVGDVGLGLWIAKEIVKRHGGQQSAVNGVDGGRFLQLRCREKYPQKFCHRTSLRQRRYGRPNDVLYCSNRCSSSDAFSVRLNSSGY